MAHGKPVTLGSSVLAQGEKTVGAATVQLVSLPTPCSRVWIGAKTGNGATIYVGSLAAGNATGGIPLETTNQLGFFYPIDDAASVYLTGSNGGDAVEYQIFA